MAMELNEAALSVLTKKTSFREPNSAIISNFGDYLLICCSISWEGVQ